MCGRYSWFTADELAEKRFHAKAKELLGVHYNAAPSQLLPVILNTEPRTIQLGRWGLIPSWEERSEKANRFINARAESVAIKPAFHDALTSRRCLILADSFFEWQKKGRYKIPYRIIFRSEEPFAFAGLWTKTDGDNYPSFAIITTTANGVVKPIHDRMPVILPKENEQDWLEEESSEMHLTLLRPIDQEEVQAYSVSPAVGVPGNDSPEVIQEVAQQRRIIVRRLTKR